jgi:integrase
MAYGNFDSTLRNYRQQGDLPPSTIDLFQQFIEFRRASDTGEYSIKNRYGVMLTHLTQFGRDIETPTDDYHNFSQRVWKAILNTAKVKPYRPPYAARHTFATWAKRHGMTDEQLAYWMGHKTTRMVREHYGHLDNQPQVPEFNLEAEADGNRAQTCTQNSC